MLITTHAQTNMKNDYITGITATNYPYPYCFQRHDFSTRPTFNVIDALKLVGPADGYWTPARFQNIGLPAIEKVKVSNRTTSTASVERKSIKGHVIFDIHVARTHFHLRKFETPASQDISQGIE